MPKDPGTYVRMHKFSYQTDYDVLNLAILVYLFSPAALSALLIYWGIKLKKKTSIPTRVTGLALIATAMIGLILFAYLVSLTRHDAWGFSWIPLPVVWVRAIAIAFGITWSLFVFYHYFFCKNISKDYLIGALILLSVCSYPVVVYMKQEVTMARANKGELSREEILHMLELDKQMRYKRYPQWLRDSLDGALRNPKLPETILSDFIEYRYSTNVGAIALHPNITPQLLDKMVDKGYADTDILQNNKTSTATLSKMYGKTSDFHTRGWIVNHKNASDEIVVDFINTALADKNKDNIYWAISSIHKMPADIFRKMSRDSDPKMRLAIADNYYAPVDVINILTEDTDSLVAYRAKDNLRLRDSTREDLKQLVEDAAADHKKEENRIAAEAKKKKDTSSDYLIQKDIAGFNYSDAKIEHSWFLTDTGHFNQDHVYTTYSAQYRNPEMRHSAFVQVTTCETSDETNWLLHEIEIMCRLKQDEADSEREEIVLRKGVDIKNILGSPVYRCMLWKGHEVTGEALGYIWLSNQTVIELHYFRDLNGRAEPTDIVQAYIQKYPSTIPSTLVLDRAHNIKWIKDEMERRLWLFKKWAASGRATRKITREMYNQLDYFLYYREKCFGKKAKKEKDIISAYVDNDNITGLQDKMTEYKEWWKNNKTKSIDLCIK